MGVAVPVLHVLGGDVLGAPIPVVVRVVVLLGRNEALEHHREVLEEAVLPLVHAHGAGGVRRVDAADAVPDTALADGGLHLVGDVGDGQPTCGPELNLPLERLHARHCVNLVQPHDAPTVPVAPVVPCSRLGPVHTT